MILTIIQNQKQKKMLKGLDQAKDTNERPASVNKPMRSIVVVFSGRYNYHASLGGYVGICQGVGKIICGLRDNLSGVRKFT